MSAAVPFDIDALAVWMGSNIRGFRPPLVVKKFAVGQSNPTYLLKAASGDYVLRHKPFGNVLPSAHAVDREYRVQSALSQSGFPVARPYAFCEDPSVIGAIFYVMERAEGRNLVDGTLPGLAPEERRAIYLSMVDLLAQLHNIPPASISLNDYGPDGNFFERQVRRWTKQYRASQTNQNETFEQLIEWLPDTLPATSGSVIVHGDFRIDNIIFHSTEPHAVALLDWELSTLGDPLADLSYFITNWFRQPDGGAGVEGLDNETSGIPSVREVIERYRAGVRRDTLPDLNWHLAYNFFRMACICQGIAKRVLDGNASSDAAASTAAMAGPLAAKAWAFARSSGESNASLQL